MTVKIIAHRGNSSQFPEHTASAYQSAIDVGADGIETDVRLTADGQVVCFHDATLERTTSGVGGVHEMTLEQLRALNHAKTGDYPGSTQLLTLGQLIELCQTADKNFLLALEIKHPNAFDTQLDTAVLKVLEEAGWDPATGKVGQVTVSPMSFNPLSLPALCPPANPKEFCMLVADVTQEDVAKEAGAKGTGTSPDPQLAARLTAAVEGALGLLNAGAAGIAGPSVQFVHDHTEAVRSWAKSMAVRVWTVDDQESFNFVVANGATQITTNRPKEALRWRKELEAS